MFLRPLFASASGPQTSKRFTGRQRLTAAVCIVLIFLSVTALLWSLRSQGISRKHAVAELEPLGHKRPATVAQPAQEISTPPLGSSPLRPGEGSSAVTQNVPKPLLGRWVVVSSEGAALGSVTSMSGASGTSFGAAGGMTGGGAAPGIMMGGVGGANANSPPLQWIEFADDRGVVFDGREAIVFIDLDHGQQPKRLSLRIRNEPTSHEQIDTNWRSGIYRLERDRLIICWTSNSQLVPDEFSADPRQGTQLVVLRREWKPPADFDPTKTPPPRAVIPFTTDEAKRYQEMWARSANVPVEVTNSLGMKLRLIPSGAFDPFQQQMLDSVYLSSYREVGVVFDPPVPSRPLYLATHEVTFGQFRKFVEATQYVTSAERASQPMTWKSPGIVQDGDEHPVVRVSWTDAMAFCKWLNETEQASYRLPLFAEWAFAARAGLAADVRIKPPVTARLKFFDTTAPVGGDTANVFGLHDVFGNVSEWTFDASVQQRDLSDPIYEGPKEKRRVFNLGGGFRSSMSDWQTALGERPVLHAKGWLILREADDSAQFEDVGFRVVREIAKEAKPPDKVEPAVQPKN